MFISVIIPVYNQLVQIKELIDSLENQTYPLGDFEVIISDDGSTDGTTQFLESYKGKLDLKSIIPTQKGSRAKARNNGLEIARGTHILFLDGDLTADKKLLEQHAFAHERHENSVFIGKVEPCHLQRNNILDWYRVSRGGQKLAKGKPIPARYFATNNASIPKTLISKSGKFNESYTSWGGEDTEMGYKLEKTGATFYYLSEALTFHNHKETLDSYKNKLAVFAKSGFIQLLKNCPEHASQGYPKLFLSRNILARFAMPIVFSSVLQRISEAIVKMKLHRKTAYLLYDYITYAEIYRNFRTQSKRIKLF
jgi:glycosyltransferase involved in cell wall biosynthesis